MAKGNSVSEGEYAATDKQCSVIAKPTAKRDMSKKLYKQCKMAAECKCFKRAAKESVKSISKNFGGCSQSQTLANAAKTLCSTCMRRSYILVHGIRPAGVCLWFCLYPAAFATIKLYISRFSRLLLFYQCFESLKVAGDVIVAAIPAKARIRILPQRVGATHLGTRFFELHCHHGCWQPSPQLQDYDTGQRCFSN